MTSVLLGIFLSTSASATPLLPDRPWVPAASVAGEAGPLQTWVNPALAVFDPDPRYGLILAGDRLGGRSAGLSAGVGGLSVGLANIVTRPGEERWIAQYGSSAQLPGKVTFGTSVNWHLVGGSGNHLAIDAGLAWRPRSWLGLGGAVRSIGAPDPTGQIPTSAVLGAVLRPLDDTLIAGIDGEIRGGPSPETIARAILRFRPREGLYLRAHADSTRTVGAGFEVYFGGVGGGLMGAAGAHAPVGALVLGSDEPGESLVPLPPRFRSWICEKSSPTCTARGCLPDLSQGGSTPSIASTGSSEVRRPKAS